MSVGAAHFVFQHLKYDEGNAKALDSVAGCAPWIVIEPLSQPESLFRVSAHLRQRTCARSQTRLTRKVHIASRTQPQQL